MNVIETIAKYLPVLDEQYRLGSKTAILDTPEAFVRMTKDAKKILIAKVRTDKLGNYSRSNGFVTGDTELTWEEHTFRYDRGRALQVDAMDNIETLGLAFGRLSGNFQRDAVIPEVDAIRIASYYAGAGHRIGVTLTAENALSTLDDINEAMDNAEVPEEGRIVFVTPTAYKYICSDQNVTKYLSVNDSATKALNRKIYEYNGLTIIKVPSSRMFREIELLDGVTPGQEKGGYIGKGTLDMVALHPTAIIQVAKRLVARFWAPNRAEMDANGADGVNPNADAWKFDYRNYHDAFVLENKQVGIVSVCAPISATAINDVPATKTIAVGEKFTLQPTLVPYDTTETLLTYTSADDGKVAVDAQGVVTGVAAGTVNVTVKAGSVTAVCAVTVE